MTLRLPVTAALAVTSTVLLAGCGGGSSSGDATGAAVSVTATDSACTVSTPTLPAGTHTFTVTNNGTTPTEVYVYGAGDKVAGEVENIGPATSKKLTVTLAADRYEVACKPGMTGDGIRTPLLVEAASVTGATASPAPDPVLAKAVEDYSAYVRKEAASLVTATAPFAAAVERGDVAGAKTLYVPARLHYERMEPVAESFGDLDPRVDARADDVTGGQAWTGFHRLERDLWQKGSVAGDAGIARQLLADTKTLAARVAGTTLTPDQIGNGAKSLLDEVATSKVTGEEERYSRTDLVDLAGNVQGARAAWLALRPAVAPKDAALASDVDTGFTQLESALQRYRRGEGYVSYDRLSKDQVRALAASVDALSEPLSRVTAVALGTGSS